MRVTAQEGGREGGEWRRGVRCCTFLEYGPVFGVVLPANELLEERLIILCAFKDLRIIDKHVQAQDDLHQHVDFKVTLHFFVQHNEDQLV